MDNDFEPQDWFLLEISNLKSQVKRAQEHPFRNLAMWLWHKLYVAGFPRGPLLLMYKMIVPAGMR